MHDSIFCRAQRGDLPSELTIADLCRLNTASLDCPQGRYAPGDDLARRLHQLVALGQIQPERTETIQHVGMVMASLGGQVVTAGDRTHLEQYLTSASLRAVLVDLGVVGPLLLAWIGAAPVEAVTAPPRRLAEPWYVARVTAFCEAISASGMIDPDAPGFTAMDVAEAMKGLDLWHRPGVPRPDIDTLRGYAAEVAAKWFAFPNGRPKGDDAKQRHKQAVGRLRALYRLAVPEENQEPGNRAPPVSTSNFQRAAG